jgi:hypothetical protein
MPTDSAAEQFREYAGIELGHVDDDGSSKSKSKSESKPAAKKTAAKKTTAKSGK